MATIGFISISQLPDILAVCFEVFIVWTFQRNWFIPKPRKKWNVWAAYLAFGILTGMFSLFYPNMLVLPVVTYIGILSVSYFLYKGQFLSHIFAAIVLLILGVASEAIVAGIYSYILQIELSQIRENDFHRAIVMLISKMLCLLFVGIITYFARKRKSSYLRTMWRTVPLLICQMILMAFLIITFYEAYRYYGELSNLDIIKMVGILLVSIFIYTYYDILARTDELKYMNQLAKVQNDNHIRHYSQVQEQEEILKSIEHDCRKFVVVFDDLIKKNHIREAANYKASIDEFLDNSISLAYVSHPVVSAIINNCLRRAKTLGVSTDLDIRIPETLRISDVDLTIILGNVLDNAIEALETIADNAEKILRIKLVQSNYYLLFEVKNTCNPEPTDSKSRKTRQSYGLKNVQNCVSKYSGEFTTNLINNTFTSTAKMNVSAPDSASK